MEREILTEMGYGGSIVLDPKFLDKAIIGISHDGRVIYDYDKLIEAFMEGNKWSYDEAVEWIDFNTIPSLQYGDNYPIIKYTLDV